ncbi:MAG: 8-oxo-dGTP diphosphatase MutT [Pedosphaera sp.]|nr:8-oxo-dGTP diphosphatase MutT [Pedosphaera sp.]MST00432.1 8-oxo-dGTP diphosphatase MutT [Pedosphaera sp.]
MSQSRDEAQHPSAEKRADAVRVIEVSAAIVFRDRRLLITQRRPQDHLGGLWEFPGGKRESGETFEECLRRELREELGAEFEVGALFDEVTHAYPEKTVRLKFYFCRWLQQEPRPLHCHAVGWITRDELIRYEFPAADATLLEKLRADLALWQ